MPRPPPTASGRRSSPTPAVPTESRRAVDDPRRRRPVRVPRPAVVSIYLLFAGHNQPGGGFVGGLVAGSRLRPADGRPGPARCRRVGPVRPMTLLGLGLALAASTGHLAPSGTTVSSCRPATCRVDVPFIGPVGTSTAFFFDLGVYLVVLGTVLMVLEALGSPEEDAPMTIHRPPGGADESPAALVAMLYGIGVYMILQRTLTKVILGLALLSHGANLLLLIVGGKAGLAPLIGSFTGGDTISDPIPRRSALTAIVISFGMTVFLLALAYRSWQLTHDDTVEDDAEDRRIAGRARLADGDELADRRRSTTTSPRPTSTRRAGGGVR